MTKLPAAFIAFFLLLSIFTQSQAPLTLKLPELLPPSPDAASLIKTGLGTLNKSTGAVNANVPLYELKMHELTLPISLSYSSQGTRVNQACSRVGSGWSLNAGGVVTRSVLGRADEFNNRGVIPADLSAFTSANYAFFSNASEPDPTTTFDTQPDEFRFSFGNYNGKFVLDANYNAVLISHSNLKVKVFRSSNNIDEIVITAPDGIVYRFGGNLTEGPLAVEKTLNTNINFRNAIATAFYLYRIELPNGEKVELYYNGISTKSFIGLNNTLTFAGGGTGNGCSQVGDEVIEKFNKQYVEYATVYLNRITTSNGVRVDFTYEERGGSTEEVRLKGVSIFDAQAGKIKEYVFQYNVTGAVVDQNDLFFLTKIIQKDNQSDEGATRDSLVYGLTYYNNQTAGGSDYLGFANGTQDGGSAIPYIPELPYRDGADRDPNPEAAKKGVLQKITYPTGGSEEFFYEANTIPVNELRNTMTEFVISGPGRATSHYDYTTTPPPYTRLVSFVRTQNASIALRTFMLNPGSGAVPPDPGTKVAYFTMRDLTTNQVVATSILEGLTSYTDHVSIVAGHNYRLELIVKGPTYIHAEAIVKYDSAAAPIYDNVNKIACGIRVNKIISYDSVDKKSVTKHYIYASLKNLNVSSGVGPLSAPFRSVSQTMTGYPGQPSYGICYYITYSSNSAYNLFHFDGSHIYYTKVIETDDLSFSNGGTEYSFPNPNNGDGGNLVMGNRFPGIPSIKSANLNGLQDSVRVFDKDKRIRSVQYTAYQNAVSLPSVPALAVRRNFSNAFTSPGDETDFLPFDVVHYFFSPGWIRPQYTITKTIDESGRMSVKREDFTYGTIANTNVKTITTQNSRNETIVINKKYPNDFTGTPIADLMITKNIINPVFEESITNNGTEMFRKVTDYKDWFNNGKVIQPSLIKLKESPAGTLTDELVYAKYDNTGNPMEAYKVNDTKFTWLWDDRKFLLIGKVDNADASQVAYSSFENNTTDSWTAGTGGSFVGNGITGYVSYSGSLSKTVPAGNYVVTLWSTSSTVTVNGATVSPAVTKGSWKLFRHSLSNITSVQVNGTVIDEVRLHPAQAQMVTFTYKHNIGVQSQCDKNNFIHYYTYDAFNRLIRITDFNQHIIKQFAYTYKEGLSPCSNTTANWIATGNKRCVKSSTNNNNTGVEEREEIDKNNCSNTFMNLRWVSLGVTGNCPVVPNCDGITKRVINGACVTGWKIYSGKGNYSNGTYYCETWYEFPDGYKTEITYEASSSPCAAN